MDPHILAKMRKIDHTQSFGYDLIKKLLIRENNLRLGAYSFGTEFDINNLKKHPFFDDMNFENLINESSSFYK